MRGLWTEPWHCQHLEVKEIGTKPQRRLGEASERGRSIGSQIKNTFQANIKKNKKSFWVGYIYLPSSAKVSRKKQELVNLGPFSNGHAYVISQSFRLNRAEANAYNDDSCDWRRLESHSIHTIVDSYFGRPGRQPSVSYKIPTTNTSSDFS